MTHKTALIVTASVSDGGSYPVAELRMSSYKYNSEAQTVFRIDAAAEPPGTDSRRV